MQKATCRLSSCAHASSHPHHGDTRVNKEAILEGDSPFLTIAVPGFMLFPDVV